MGIADFSIAFRHKKRSPFFFSRRAILHQLGAIRCIDKDRIEPSRFFENGRFN